MLKEDPAYKRRSIAWQVCYILCLPQISRTELMKSDKVSSFYNKRKYKHVHAMISKSKDEILKCSAQNISWQSKML
jgi:hypothetical protein